MSRRLLVALLCLLCSASACLARVLSYSPLSDRISIPSIHHRQSRYFALVEALPGQLPYNRGQVVLYDTAGEEEPRVIYPSNASEDRAVFLVALYERASDSGGTAVTVLVGAFDPTSNVRTYFLSNDRGATWLRVADLDREVFASYMFAVDFGGPFTRGLGPQVSIGGVFPFVLSFNSGRIRGVTLEGKTQLLYKAPTVSRLNNLIGRDRSGSRLLVRTGEGSIGILDTGVNGTPKALGQIPFGGATGWITGSGDAYVQVYTATGRVLYLFRNGTRQELRARLPGAPPVVADVVDISFFAVPTSDFDGAWMIQRTASQTILSRHTAASGKETFWSDLSAPEVEALHTGSDPNILLLQVHRARVQDEHTILDPALAVWRVGQPAPAAYDELYVNEALSKGFLHVDADTLESGSAFVFDSGINAAYNLSNNGRPDPAAGGADVVQEWGALRGSLRQHLVIPGIARQNGLVASQWRTDVVLHNPLNEPQDVAFRFAGAGTTTPNARQEGPAGGFGGARTNANEVPRITLAAHEIRVLRDVVKSLFGFDQGGGTMFLDPDVAIEATSRTYARGNGGRYGFGMPAIDALNLSSARFPVTFAGAFPGSGFRTNLLFTEMSGRGTEARLIARDAQGVTGTKNLFLTAPPNAVLQTNGLASALAIDADATAGLEIVPTRGSMIPTLVAIDNRTNDPTWLPADLGAPNVRTIPIFGRFSRTDGIELRSDLHLTNPASRAQIVYLEMKRTDTTEIGRRLSFILGPGETRVIRDALSTLIGVNGFARLRFTSGGPGDPGVRMTSRMYAEDGRGGTYGCLVPPLNAFQSAGTGERIQILGIDGDVDSRVTLGLLDLNANYNGRTAEARIHIFDAHGREIDTFSIAFPIAGGVQLEDLAGKRGLPTDEALLIEIEVRSGLIAAWALLTDKGTNDCTYLGASRSARAK